ncbi:MAG: hypothetical protein IJ223_04020 [Clostridia bacterium]|nr:hypothetical protein [Clostridia bacterium]
MKFLTKSLVETVIFFILFTLITFIFDHDINWKLIIIGTIVNLDFNLILNWMSEKKEKK